MILWWQLSDVTAGGRTAFPEAGIALSPEKGAAVLWFNVKKNGYFNTKALHGGCPVLLGQKWGETLFSQFNVAFWLLYIMQFKKKNSTSVAVANRWIRENANFLRRPCSSDPQE